MTTLKNVTSPCRKCKNMVCRTRTKDCHDVHDASLSAYHEDETTEELALVASSLIDNGKAGTLNRVQEVIEFCISSGYTSIGVAYCFGMKTMAIEFCELLESAGLHTAPVSCTSGAVKECEIDTRKEDEVVSCNPAGQAMVLNRMELDLVVEMGLCLGHDVILHKLLKHGHTVLVVKDRMLFHNPSAAFSTYRDGISSFIEALDSTFFMRSPEWLLEQFRINLQLTVIDLRDRIAFDKCHIPSSIHIPLKKLPQELHQLRTENTIVCVCNGSVQSAYAIAFLFSRGFQNVYNLSGGFSRWEREGYDTVSS